MVLAGHTVRREFSPYYFLVFRGQMLVIADLCCLHGLDAAILEEKNEVRVMMVIDIVSLYVILKRYSTTSLSSPTNGH